ncbi:unnamed protein product, partial [Trichogramma brassicae]
KTFYLSSPRWVNIVALTRISAARRNVLCKKVKAIYVQTERRKRKVVSKCEKRNDRNLACVSVHFSAARYKLLSASLPRIFLHTRASGNIANVHIKRFEFQLFENISSLGLMKKFFFTVDRALYTKNVSRGQQHAPIDDLPRPIRTHIHTYGQALVYTRVCCGIDSHTHTEPIIYRSYSGIMDFICQRRNIISRAVHTYIQTYTALPYAYAR